MTSPSLTPRLRTVAELVPAGARLADVGTDHAYLPAYLLTQDRVPSAIATDIRSGPLVRARETSERFGLAERLSLRLCDGLAGVSPDEVDAVAIAGMGGETILGILEAAPWSLDKACILQPMSASEVLRAGLDRLGSPIVREVLAQEGDILYVTFYVNGTNAGKGNNLTEAEHYVGTAEAHGGDPLWPAYLELSCRRVRRALEGLTRSKKPEDEGRRTYFERVLAGLDKMANGEEEL